MPLSSFEKRRCGFTSDAQQVLVILENMLPLQVSCQETCTRFAGISGFRVHVSVRLCSFGYIFNFLYVELGHARCRVAGSLCWHISVESSALFRIKCFKNIPIFDDCCACDGFYALSGRAFWESGADQFLSKVDCGMRLPEMDA